MKLSRTSWPVPAFPASLSGSGRPARGFSLIEIMVVIALFSLIILALLGVFNTTQGAFRASVTQTDVQEGGRAAMDLITTDLRAMTASGGYSNAAVNFYANPSVYYNGLYNEPLLQSLAPGNYVRTNVLEDMFILTRLNQTWTGVGYVVDFTSSNYINPLYRFSMTTNVQSADPRVLYSIFTNKVFYGDWSGMSRLMQGVVHFTVRAYGTNGQWLAYGSTNGPAQVNYPFVNWDVGGFCMYSNALPAMVELQLGVLEDRALRHAEGLPVLNVRSNYLSGQAGKVHLFRQEVTVPNFDSAANQ